MKTVPNAPRTRFVLRPYRRIPTWYSSYYMSGSVIGKGVVKNLSRTGLRVLGDHSLTPGTEVTIRLHARRDRSSVGNFQCDGPLGGPV